MQIPVGSVLKDPACQGNELAEWNPGLSHKWMKTNALDFHVTYTLLFIPLVWSELNPEERKRC